MSKYDGMTTNERLLEAGKFTEFDKAVSEGDRGRLIEIFSGLEFDTRSAGLMADRILANPEKYR